MSDFPINYRIPTGTAEFKFTVKGSKFIGYCAAAEDESTALEIIRQRSRLHHNASHNCWAFRVVDPENPVERSSDDGEPSGTAGRPILEQLAKRNMVGAVMIVSRWFGGTKLGRGGLIRAYGGCAAGTLENVKSELRQPTSVIEVECGYNMVGFVERTAARCQGSVEGGDYGETVRLNVSLPVEKDGEFRKIIADEGGGRVRIVNTE